MSDLRNRIFEVNDSEVELVNVPQWGDIEVEVRSMSGTERAAFLSSYTNDDGTVNWQSLYPSLLIATVFDPSTGEKVFLPEDEDAINSKSGAALESIAGVALRLSGMERDSEAKAGKSS